MVFILPRIGINPGLFLLISNRLIGMKDHYDGHQPPQCTCQKKDKIPVAIRIIPAMIPELCSSLCQLRLSFSIPWHTRYTETNTPASLTPTYNTDIHRVVNKLYCPPMI